MGQAESLPPNPTPFLPSSGPSLFSLPHSLVILDTVWETIWQSPRHQSAFWPHSPLQTEVKVVLGLLADVLPEFLRGHHRPGRVIRCTQRPVSPPPVPLLRNQLISWQVGHGVGVGAQETVKEVADGSREARELHTLPGRYRRAVRNPEALPWAPPANTAKTGWEALIPVSTS